MQNRDRKISFRIVGAVLILVGLVGLSNPRMILPSSMSWSGDFWLSDYGLRLHAFTDLINLTILIGSLLLVLSFTTLTDSSRD